MRPLVVACVLAFSLACRTESPRAGAAPMDAAAVESTLVRFSVALARADTATLRTLAAPTFVLLDEGKAYDLDATVASILSVLATAQMTRVPKDVRVERRGDVAWASYRVQGDFRTGSATVPLRMLEAAVLERTRDGWRVAQMATLAER
ncbi:MAG: nuclear transport factor 2 family protein [Gemmatimonadaceae bacterium]